jgi:hypothetical protein
MSYFPNALAFGDNTAIDAFGRAKVSTPETIFESGFQYDTGNLVWETILTGTGSLSHLPNSSGCNLTVSTGVTDLSRHQTREYFRYQPGKSLLTYNSFMFGTAVTNTTRRVGYFDDQNGIYFEQLGSGTLNVVRRTFSSGAIVNNTVAQASWNKDTMQGNGPSGITLDITKSQILWIDLQWLGEGRIRVGFDINGIAYPVHEFLIANIISTVSLTSANLPLRYEIFNTGASAGGSLTQICSTVISEGSFNKFGQTFSTSNTTGSFNVTSRRPILSIRPKSTLSGITNRGNIIPKEIDFLVGSNNVFWEIVYSGSLTGPTWASVDGNSVAEFDVAATAISGGITIQSGYVAAGSAANRLSYTTFFDHAKKYPIVLNASGSAPINYSVVVTSLNSTAVASSALTWDEQR